jgi:imidazolonepropionase-like amidohydrolase
MPGLADMHVHLSGDFNPVTGERWQDAEQINRAFSIIFIANGITTVRNMWGSPEVLELRRRIQAGSQIGPNIVTTGIINDGSPVIWAHSRDIKNASEAKAAVLEDQKAGYDAVKVYNRLSIESYDAIIATVWEQGLPVYGHVPTAIGLLNVLAAKQNSIEHLTGYLAALRHGSAQLSAVDDMDESKILDVVRRTREAGTWNCATLVVMQNQLSPTEAEKVRLKPSMKYVPPADMNLWNQMVDMNAKTTPEVFVRLRKEDAFYLQMTKALFDDGARLLIGTDTPNPFVVPGFALHEELQNFVNAGLTPYQTLKIATADAAEFLGKSNEFGTVAVGKRADLLLLDLNPCKTSRTLRRDWA